MPFQKGHPFYGDLTKPNYFQKGHPKSKNAYTWSKGHRLFSKGTLGKHWKVSEQIRIRMSEIRKGPRAYNWKGGPNSKNCSIRHSLESRLWREAIFARDNWICQKYRTKGRILHPHHIENFAEFPALRFAVNNGITFSKGAHREFHRIYGTKNNTREQLKNFLKT